MRIGLWKVCDFATEGRVWIRHGGLQEVEIAEQIGMRGARHSVNSRVGPGRGGANKMRATKVRIDGGKLNATYWQGKRGGASRIPSHSKT